MMLDLNDPTIRHNPESMAEMRSRGKVHWHTPVRPPVPPPPSPLPPPPSFPSHPDPFSVHQEQFSSEWEYHYPLPVDAAVAGNYSWKTNLWQMAQVMWCLITQYQPPVGPIPRRFAGRWTYGYALVDEDDNYGSVSRSLRETVTHCMMDDPAHRPALDQLLLVIQSNLDLESTRPGASEAAAAWCAQNIGPGGPPPPPPPMRLAQALEDVSWFLFSGQRMCVRVFAVTC